MGTFNDDDINPFILLIIDDIHRDFTRLHIDITSVRFLRHKVVIIGKRNDGTNVGATARFDIPNAPPRVCYHNLPWHERR